MRFLAGHTGEHCGRAGKSVQTLADKYAVTYLELDKQIQASEAALAAMMDDLTGSEFDMKGLGEFQSLLKGE